MAVELGISRGFSAEKSLRNKLGKFYAGSELLPLPILPAAAAVFHPSHPSGPWSPILTQVAVVVERAELSVPHTAGTSVVQSSFE